MEIKDLAKTQLGACAASVEIAHQYVHVCGGQWAQAWLIRIQLFLPGLPKQQLPWIQLESIVNNQRVHQY